MAETKTTRTRKTSPEVKSEEIKQETADTKEQVVKTDVDTGDNVVQNRDEDTSDLVAEPTVEANAIVYKDYAGERYWDAETKSVKFGNPEKEAAKEDKSNAK
ncbi:hypothetical protein [Macrococcoides canis]|uniref:hypothetical protein n=1 Tax=Macrococcoides canis TaxID=1855823 RepID=UPI00165DF3DC|nr:hypothetical protein [Macrococcus canis]QNR08246.1 hypothetical protein GL258_08230 [Macrococcus canis]